jgi:aminobenzoyl-glutamate utilization protein B
MHIKPENCRPYCVRIITLAIALIPSQVSGQQPAPLQQIPQLVDQHAAHFSGISRTIWEYAEVGYQEVKSSAVLQRQAAVSRLSCPITRC